MIKFTPKKLSELRKKAGFTLEALAKIAGITYNSLWRIEKGEREPNTPTLCKLADALGLSSLDMAIFFKDDRQIKRLEEQRLIDAVVKKSIKTCWDDEGLFNRNYKPISLDSWDWIDFVEDLNFELNLFPMGDNDEEKAYHEIIQRVAQEARVLTKLKFQEIRNQLKQIEQNLT